MKYTGIVLILLESHSRLGGRDLRFYKTIETDGVGSSDITATAPTKVTGSTRTHQNPAEEEPYISHLNFQEIPNDDCRIVVCDPDRQDLLYMMRGDSARN